MKAAMASGVSKQFDTADADRAHDNKTETKP
jgi:hypothetical protein